MDFKPMTILIIEDDVDACNKFRECAKRRNDIQIVKITDSDIDGLEYAKEKRPEGIILDLELNNSSNGNVSSMGIVSKLRKISPNYEPVIIVTTHVNSKRTYEILHRDNVDLIMYKEQANYSSENVFNTLLTYRKEEIEELPETYELEKQDLENRFWDLFNGGKIQYVKYPIAYNKEAIKTLLKRAMDKGFYEGVNLSLSYCDDCGHQELNMDVCPKCGSKNLTKIDRMNGYLSYSRVKGDTRLNEAKMEEIKDRVSM